MADAHLNAIFNEDLDDDYENIMDCVVDPINYGGDDDNGGLGWDGDDGANDDEDDDSDVDDESFWKRDFDKKKVSCVHSCDNKHVLY
jgi:hypothetical protein